MPGHDLMVVNFAFKLACPTTVPAATLLDSLTNVTGVFIMMNPSTQRHLLYLHAAGKGANVGKGTKVSTVLNKFTFLGIKFLSEEVYNAGQKPTDQWTFAEFVASFSVDVDSAGTLPPKNIVALMLTKQHTNESSTIPNPRPTPGHLSLLTTTKPGTRTRAGMVYAARTQSMISIIKIGYTRQDEIISREKSLSNTSVSSEFDSVAHFRTTDCIEM
eukprot:836847-Rhodomonas_salina.3